MLLSANGEAVSPDNKAEDAKTDELEPAVLQIDSIGNLTFCMPLHKTGEVFARGFVDLCRTQVLRWYVSQDAKKKEMEVLSAKTGYQRFKDKLLRRQ